MDHSLGVIVMMKETVGTRGHYPLGMIMDESRRVRDGRVGEELN
jgi:hypothetical protein